MRYRPRVVAQAYFCPDANCGMVYDIHDFGKLERVEETGGRGIGGLASAP